MVKLRRDIDPQFFERFGTEPMEELPEWGERRMSPRRWKTRVVEWHGRQSVARRGVRARIRREARRTHFQAHRLFAERAAHRGEAYRAVVGLTESQCTDDEAIDRLLNPARNIYRLETLNVGVHAPLMRALQHANYTFAKKISHTADSQDQRHRMVPGSRPLLTLSDTREPDYITPMLLDRNARAKEVYERAMHDAWKAKNELLDRGVPAEIALYVLAEREIDSPGRERFPAASAAQMDDANLLQRAGRNLSRRWMNSISFARSSAIREIHRPAVLSARRNYDADLHGRLALLRRQSLA